MNIEDSVRVYDIGILKAKQSDSKPQKDYEDGSSERKIFIISNKIFYYNISHKMYLEIITMRISERDPHGSAMPLPFKELKYYYS